MAWIVLVVSGVFEAVWATAHGKTEGFTRLIPTIVFVTGLALSMGGLAYAMRSLPIGTSYAVWVGIGAVLTVAYAMVFDGESSSPLKLLFLFGIVVCVVGLKLVHRVVCPGLNVPYTRTCFRSSPRTSPERSVGKAFVGLEM